MGGQCSKQTESKEKTEQKIVTSLGSHEVKALTEMFRAMDADHNGTVSWEEMLAMAENREHKASEEVVASLREMFDQMDTNHDGRVNLQEYITFQEAEHDRRLAELDASQKENAFDENKANTQMDRYSRAIAALGVDTMQNMMSLKVLVIGLTGVGIETAKDLILAGPQAVTVHDDDTTQLADLGTNFYLKLDHVESKAKRGPACVPALSELNPYVTVSAHEGALTTEFLHTFGAVIVSKHLPKAELFRINQACRSRQLNGVAAPVSFILALTYGASFFLFSDFGDAHLITDYNGESVDSQIVQSIDELGGVHVAGDAHDLDDGDRVKLSEIEGATFLNDLESIPVKRIYSKVADLDGDGKQKTDSKGNPKWRSVNVQKTFQLDFSDNKEILEKFRAEETKWTGGGIINYVKPQKTVNYKSLEATLNNPLNDQNFFVQHLDDERTYSGRGNQLHLAFAALLDFEEKHNRFPVLHSQEDAKEMVAVATAVNTARGSSEGMVVDSLDADVITMFSLYAATELSGSCAFLGGAVAQEVVKKFGKYTPLNQWLTVDYFELLPGGTTVPADAAPIGSRYDHQIAIFGKAIQDKILAQKWFLVGCGALGCEYIKAFAMMGIGASPEGKVHITDLDTIELSNLSRQFLFRSEHINKFKSESAAVVAKQMNPDMNLQCHVTKVCDETEHIFDDAFWNGLDGVWNALDNIHARHYTDGKCVIYGKPLIESGTEGTKANSSVHIPHQTLTYSDTPVQETGKIAACTLRNFPHLDVHCIEWARPRFESLFAHGPQQVNTLCSDEKKFFETLRKEPAHDGIATLKELIALMTEAKGRDFASAARLAATEFTTQFRNRIKDLIYCFPEDARSTKLMEDGTKLDTGPFWGGKKRFPSACELDLSNDTHFNFMHSATNLFLFVFGQAPVDAATFRTQIASVDLSLPDWVAPTETVDVSEETEEKKDVADDAQTLAELEALCTQVSALAVDFQPLVAAEFEKDDDTNFHIDFITACSNMRSWNYRIQPATRLRVKVVAGKIIAALASTTAMITGLASLEFYKLVLGLQKDEKTNPFFDTNVNLATATFNSYSVQDPKKEQGGFDEVMQEEIKVVPENFTTWDFLKVDGDLTCAELCALIPTINHGSQCLKLQKLKFTDDELKAGLGNYMYQNPDEVFTPEEKKMQTERGAQTVSALYQELYGEIAASRSFILLGGECITADDEPCKVPPIMLRFRNPKPTAE